MKVKVANVDCGSAQMVITLTPSPCLCRSPERSRHNLAGRAVEWILSRTRTICMIRSLTLNIHHICSSRQRRGTRVRMPMAGTRPPIRPGRWILLPRIMDRIRTRPRASSLLLLEVSTPKCRMVTHNSLWTDLSALSEGTRRCTTRPRVTRLRRMPTLATDSRLDGRDRWTSREGISGRLVSWSGALELVLDSRSWRLYRVL